MIRHANESTARRAVAPWGGDPATLRPRGVSGSAVWQSGDRVLRLVDPGHRTREQTESELAFMRHLAARGAPVAVPVAALDGAWTHEVDGFVASVVTWLPGDERPPELGTPPFDRAWGRALATLHVAARDYAGPARWEWPEEPWLAEADRLLPPDDTAVRATWAELQARLGALPRSHTDYGTIHGDHGPQNYRYDAATEVVTTFDFGNAYRHWFAMDVTVALSTLRRDPARESRGAALLAGYAAVAGAVPLLREAWPDLLRLRFLYVYLSRLDAFGPSPDAAQQATLAGLRDLVAHGPVWPLPEDFR